MINKLRQYKNKLITKRLPEVCARSRFLSGLYYFLFSDAFSREHQSVLAGKVKHIHEARSVKNNYFLLVRNTHRLEKGLLMRPRKAIFAKDYIAETVDNFEGVWSKRDEYQNNPQIKWFYDVLSEYFDKTGEDAFVLRQKQRFQTIVNGSAETSCAQSTVKAIPYYRNLKERTTINFEEFYKLTKQRRSVRWFLNKPVPRELIDKAVLAANQSPSACNRQPFEFRIFDDTELVKQLVKLPMGTAGYGQSIPVMIVVIGNLDAYMDERDRHVIYIDASLASMSFMLALETLGLSSCSINWPDIEAREAKMQEFLKLKAYQRPIMCIGLGYPDPEGMVAFSEKRELDEIRKYNNIGN